MKLPSFRSLFAKVFRSPLSAIGLGRAHSVLEEPIPKSFSEAMRHGEDERPKGPLEHSGVQPLGTPEFDHINYEERRRKFGSSSAA